MAISPASIGAQPPVSEIFKAVQPCVKCGATDRYKDGKCKACNKAVGANYRATNTEKLKASSAEYRAKNAEKIRNTPVRVRDPVARSAYEKAYYMANADRIRTLKVKWNASWTAANRDKKRSATDSWNAAHPELRLLSNQNRRARKNSAGGVLSKGLSKKLFSLQQGKCPCCAQPLGDDYHLDHVIPLVLDGPNEDWNMQLLRKKCNLQKNKKEPLQFMQERGFLL